VYTVAAAGLNAVEHRQEPGIPIHREGGGVGFIAMHGVQAALVPAHYEE
jgi:hypothetical protein